MLGPAPEPAPAGCGRLQVVFLAVGSILISYPVCTDIGGLLRPALFIAGGMYVCSWSDINGASQMKKSGKGGEGEGERERESPPGRYYQKGVSAKVRIDCHCVLCLLDIV